MLTKLSEMSTNIGYWLHRLKLRLMPVCELWEPMHLEALSTGMAELGGSFPVAPAAS